MTTSGITVSATIARLMANDTDNLFLSAFMLNSFSDAGFEWVSYLCACNNPRSVPPDSVTLYSGYCQQLKA